MLRLMLLFIVLIVPSLPLLVTACNVPAMFEFGDSIFDAGNNRLNPNCTLQADYPPYGSSFFHYPTGRFSNGRTVPDFISEFIGIDFQKPYREAQIAVTNGRWKDYPSNGLNFASAGSGVLPGTNIAEVVTPLQEQLQQFETLVKQNRVQINLVKQSIFLFESGSNDIFNYFSPLLTPKPNPTTYVLDMMKEVKNWVDHIYKLGARRIAIFSLGPVGCVPARALLPGVSPNGCFDEMNDMIIMYNKGLDGLARDIPTLYPGTIAVFGHVYDVVEKMKMIPQRYGLSDVTHACCGSGTLGAMVLCGKKGYKLCPNPDKFLFWDSFHPSQHAYKIVAKALWAGKQHRVRPFNLSTLASISLNHI